MSHRQLDPSAFSLDALEHRVLLSSSEFDDGVSLDAEFNRQGVTIVRADIADADDCDTYSFTARETGKLRIVLKELNDSGIDGTFTLFDEAGNVLRDKNARGPGGRELADYTAEIGERFFVQVGAAGGEFGDYRLRVRTEPGPVPGELLELARQMRYDDDFTENGGTVATFEGVIDDERSHYQPFRFTARDDGRAGIIARPLDNLDLKMVIADGDGELLRIKNGRGPGVRESALFDVVAGVHYHVFISGVWGENQSGDFRLRTRAPAGDPPILDIGGITVDQAEELEVFASSEGPRVSFPGVRTRYYFLNDPQELPDFSQLTPYKASSTPTPFIERTDGVVLDAEISNGLGIDFDAQFAIETGGTYEFTLSSDDGSRLLIDGEVVVENEVRHFFGTATGEVELAAGTHDFRVEYFENRDEAGLELRYNGADTDFTDQLVQESVFISSFGSLTNGGQDTLLVFDSPSEGDFPVEVLAENDANLKLGLYDDLGNLLVESDVLGPGGAEQISFYVYPGARHYILINEGTANPATEIEGIPVEDASRRVIIETPLGPNMFNSLAVQLDVYDLAENPPSSLPDFEGLTRTSFKNISDPVFEPGAGDVFGIGLTDNFALSMDGLLRIDQSGVWEFALSSDDGSRLFIDGDLLIDHDGPHAFTTKTGSVELQEGFHEFRIDYFEGTGSAGLTVEAKAPGADSFEPLPTNMWVDNTLRYGGTSELFLIEADRSGTLPINIQQVQPDSDVNIAIRFYDLDGNLLFEEDRNGRNLPELAQLELVEGESYYFVLADNTGVPNIEGQSLADIDVVNLNANNEALAELALNEAQPDAVQFLAPVTGEYNLTISGGFVGRITLFDDTGAELTRELRREPNSDDASFTLSVEAASGIVIAFDANAGSGEPGAAQLAIEGPGGSVDGLAIEDAIVVGHDSLTNGTIGSGDDRSLFVYTAEQASTTFTLQNFNSLDGRMKIYDEFGILLDTADLFGPNETESIDFTRDPGFLFYIVIDGKGTTGNFRLGVA